MAIDHAAVQTIMKSMEVSWEQAYMVYKMDKERFKEGYIKGFEDGAFAVKQHHRMLPTTCPDHFIALAVQKIKDEEI